MRAMAAVSAASKSQAAQRAAASPARRSPGAPSLVRNDGREAGPGVELHLPVAEVVAQVEEDGQAVVEAVPTDAPLVDERDGVLLGACRVVGGLGLHLRVDDELGAGALLDGGDGLAELVDRLGADDLGVVVDAQALDGVRERRPGLR